MKIPKYILQAMLVAVASGGVISCSKPKAEEVSKPGVHSPKGNAKTDQTATTPDNCPACGMG